MLQGSILLVEHAYAVVYISVFLFIDDGITYWDMIGLCSVVAVEFDDIATYVG